MCALYVYIYIWGVGVCIFVVCVCGVYTWQCMEFGVHIHTFAVCNCPKVFEAVSL